MSLPSSIPLALRRILFKLGREDEFQLPERMVPVLLQELEGRTLEQVGPHDCTALQERRGTCRAVTPSVPVLLSGSGGDEGSEGYCSRCLKSCSS